jgi:hypothetical protein
MWARQSLIDSLVTIVVTAERRDHAEAITFLTAFATFIEDPDVRDSVLRELEHEQRSYRRALVTPAET